MSKHQVDEHKYTQLINEKMKEHSEYKDGMCAKITPKGSVKPSGIQIEGGIGANGITAWAQSKIDEEYELIVSR